MTFLVGLAVFGLLIVIHEWGHYIVAKLLGVQVPVFSVGLGPAVFGREWNGTYYCISALPLGGYVLIGDPEKPSSIPPLKRVPIYLAGPLVNFVAAAALCVLVKPPEVFVQMCQQMAHVLYLLFTLQLDPGGLMGPAGIMQVAGQSAEKGPVALVLFTAMLSLNLAVLNMLPLPILDGGQILIALFEAAIRRPLNERVRYTLAATTMVMLLGLFAYVTRQDILRMIDPPPANEEQPAAVEADTSDKPPPVDPDA